MGASFLICTRDRPDELRRCVETILVQTRLPEEIVIVDASRREQERWLRELVEPHGVRLVCLRTRPGRTAQLNTGVHVANGDPICIVDDDVELDPGWLAAVLRAFEDHGPEVAGVQGVISNAALPSPVVAAFLRVFLLTRNTRDKPGRMLPSGYYTSPVRPTAATLADALRLTAVAYRRHVFEGFSFDDSLPGPAFKEDIDFSYRVSRRHRLLVAPDARAVHLRTPRARIGVREEARMHVVHNHRLFRKNFAPTTLEWAAHSWALLGRVIFVAVKSAARRDASHLVGTVQGLADVGRGRWRPARVRVAARSVVPQALEATLPHGPPVASVVILSRNDTGALDRVLGGLRAQTGPGRPFEVLLVDSSDDGRAAELARIHADGLPLRTIRSAVPLTPGAARNLGLAHARGRYVAFLASDCVPARDWLARRLAHHAAGQAAVAGAVECAPPRTLVARTQWLTRFAPALPGRPGGIGRAPLFGWSYDRAILTRPFREDLHLGEDTELNLDLLDRGVRVLFDPRIRIQHVGLPTFGDVLAHQARHGRSTAELIRDGAMPRLAERYGKPGRIVGYALVKWARGLREVVRAGPAEIAWYLALTPWVVRSHLAWIRGVTEGLRAAERPAGRPVR